MVLHIIVIPILLALSYKTVMDLITKAMVFIADRNKNELTQSKRA